MTVNPLTAVPTGFTHRRRRGAELFLLLLALVVGIGGYAAVGLGVEGEIPVNIVGYGGWLANGRVPEVFSRYGCTVHIPRRPYRESLPGVPTIRVFEALACGVPLVCLRWDDIEGLFTPGADFLVARHGREMREHLRAVLHDPELARSLAEPGRQTILERHTCAHLVDELLAIYAELTATELPA